MGYLKEFLVQINNRDHHKFLVLWEEYCANDQVDVEEFRQLLKAIKSSELARHFGQIVETALPIWKLIENKEESYEIFRQLIDLQTTNSPALGELTFTILKKYHGEDPKYSERLRLAGLRNKENFQGAISRYDLVAHFGKGNMVFHTGGWGVGEIVDVSFVREHVSCEFEAGKKDLSFPNAFKTLIPLSASHFLARRFADADRLEQEGRKDPVGLIKLLLHDIGPQAAAEIKEALCDLVIPEKDWNKWWQNTRAKIKKDPLIETPETLKEPFILRKAEFSTEEKLDAALKDKKETGELVTAVYNFVRDNQETIKSPVAKQQIEAQLTGLLQANKQDEALFIQIFFLLEQLNDGNSRQVQAAELICESKNIRQLIEKIDVIAFKKKALVLVKELRSDWAQVFLDLLFVLSQTQQKDYIFRELNQPEYRSLLESRLKQLLEKPEAYPEMFLWYFQKVVTSSDEGDIPYHGMQGRSLFFEAFFVLMHLLENQLVHRDLLKKMYSLLSAQRYALVRKLLQGTSLGFTEEILLLASKCQTLSSQDMKILRSLAEVVHPSLIPAKQKKNAGADEGRIWTTEEGYLRAQQRAQHIATIEVVENAREIEEARKHGDLRENAEFKAAMERRARLQNELKELSDQLAIARIITPDDVHRDQVSVGSIVEIVDEEETLSHYTILGRWDADTDKNIISFDSKFAQAVMGKKMGERFAFKDQDFKVVQLSSFFERG